jgi:hypothetical protein
MDTEQAVHAIEMDSVAPAQQPMSPMSLLLFPRGLAEIQALDPDVEDTRIRDMNNALPNPPPNTLPDRPPSLANVSHATLRPQTQECWDSWKPMIERLYRTRNLPLGDVIGIMKERFCFSAR